MSTTELVGARPRVTVGAASSKIGRAAEPWRISRTSTGFRVRTRVRRARVWLYSDTLFPVMAPTSKALVVTSDCRAAEGFRLGFEREGLPVAIATTVERALAGLLKDVGVIVARADHDAARPDAGKVLLEALIATLARSAGGHAEVPVLYVGNGVSRADGAGRRRPRGAQGSGLRPRRGYRRPAVAGRRTENRSVMDGDLDAAFGVFYLIRALAAMASPAP